MTQHMVISVGSNLESQCIRTWEWLVKKHRKMLEVPDGDVVVPDRKIGGRGRGHGKRGPALTPAEHDVIYIDAQRPKLSLEMLARKYGRSTSVILKVKNKRHPLYDSARTEAALAAAKKTQTQ